MRIPRRQPIGHAYVLILASDPEDSDAAYRRTALIRRNSYVAIAAAYGRTAFIRAAVSSEKFAVACRHRAQRYSIHLLRRCHRQNLPSLARVGRLADRRRNHRSAGLCQPSRASLPQSVCALRYAGKVALIAKPIPETSRGERGASIFKMMDVSRHRSMDTLRGYVRDADLFRDHADAGLL